MSGPARRSANDLRCGSSWDGALGAKSSALARLFVIVGVGIGVNEGFEVEGFRRDSRDGTGLGVGIDVGVDAERMDSP